MVAAREARDNKINGKSTYLTNWDHAQQKVQLVIPRWEKEGRVITVAGCHGVGNRDNEINWKSIYPTDRDHAQPEVWLVVLRWE